MIKYRVQLLLISCVDGKESSFSLGVRYNCSFSKVRSDVFQQYNLSGSDSTNTWAISYLGMWKPSLPIQEGETKMKIAKAPAAVELHPQTFYCGRGTISHRRGCLCINKMVIKCTYIDPSYEILEFFPSLHFTSHFTLHRKPRKSVSRSLSASSQWVPPPFVLFDRDSTKLAGRYSSERMQK